MVVSVAVAPAEPAPAPGGLRRVVGITASLMTTQVLTRVLGLGYWTLAARTFPSSEVGVAAAAVALMTLLGTLGSLGLGTLLIARLPLTGQGSRRVLVRTSLLTAGAASAALAVVVPLVARHGFGAENLAPLVATPLALVGLAVGTGLFGATLVLDQAVLTIGNGNLQLERNVVASAVKIVALAGLLVVGAGGGMAIFLAWTIGTAVSLPIVSWRTRGGRALQTPGRLVDLSLLRDLGKLAASHHALNISLQASLQILPIMVTVLVSAEQNAYFNSASMVAGIVFALPYSIAIGLFAAADGDVRGVVSRMTRTIPAGIALSLAAYAVLYPLAGFGLRAFGQDYADEGVTTLRVLALAGVAFVVKDHYIALRRVQGRTTRAVGVTTAFLVAELAAAGVGAHVGGVVGLCTGYVAVLGVEALVLLVPLHQAWREHQGPGPVDEPGRHRPTAVDRPLRVDLPADPARSLASLVTAGPEVPVQGRPRPARGEVPAPPHAGSRPSPTPRPSPGPRPPVRGAAGTPVRDRPRNLTGPVVLVMALGVLVMAVAAAASRQSAASGWLQATWVAGLVLVMAPPAARILLASTGRVERTALAVALPVVLQLSRLVLNPTRFTYNDELIHGNTLRQIAVSSRLFSDNPLLPVSGFYPGLEVVTDAVAQTTGLSPFAAAQVVLVAARVVLALGVIGLVTGITGSHRAAAVAAVVYACNSQFLFFNSQYSYQTLALPLAVLTVHLVASRRRGTRTALLLPLLGIGATAVTHHVTSMLLVATLAVWALADRVVTRRGRPRGRRRAGAPRPARPSEAGTLGLLALAMGVASLGMALLPGNPVGSYLETIVASSSSDVSGLLGGSSSKKLFANAAGAGPAPWEQVLLLAATLLVTASMLLALRLARDRWRARAALGLMLAVLALLYPVIPGGHITSATAEVGDRAAGFVYLGTAVVVGWWVAERRLSVVRTAVATVLVLVVYLGNITLGTGPVSQQLPGPYLVSADARSIDGANLAAAAWLAANVPEGTRTYSDRVGSGLDAAYGGTFAVRNVSTNIDASRLILDPELTAADYDLVRRAELSYVVVDRRLATGLPNAGVYIESGEFGGQDRTEPVPAEALTKLDGVPGVERVYDNGAIAIYDVRAMRDAR